MSISVKLQQGSLTVTVNPGEDQVAASSAPTTITWVRDNSGDAFTFASLEITARRGIFGVPSYQGGTMTVSDDHTGPLTEGEFPYTLTVDYGGGSFSTNSSNQNPRIHNL